MTNCSCDTFTASGSSPACNVNQSGSTAALVVNNTGTSTNNSHGIEAFSSAQGTYALYAQCNGNGCGVGAFCNTGNAIIATATTGSAVNASNSSTINYTINASNTATGGTAIRGIASGNSSSSCGVFGTSNYGNGVHGYSTSGYGVYCDGAAYVTGYLTKSGGGYRIDHPNDPENKFLNHNFVESPEMMNVYRGRAIFDINGEATVSLPSYFCSANEQPEYQLTPVGSAMPNLHVSQEVMNCSFKLAGGVTGKSVSWQVTAARADKWAKINNPGVEIDKADKKGFYLHPELFGVDNDKVLKP